MLSMKAAPLRPDAPIVGMDLPDPPAPAASAREIPDSVWPAGTVQVYGRDAAIFCEGDRAHSWYRLVSGTLRVFRVLSDGRRHIGDFVFPGQFFGFELDDTHIHGAEAIEPASVVAYSLARIEQRMAQDQVARHAMRRILIERLSAAQDRMLTLGRLNAAERLAAFLLAMARRGGRAACTSQEGLVAELPMSRVDIADYLGMTVETASRLFSALKNRGLIRLPTASRVEIPDAAALAGAAGARGGSAAERGDEAPLSCCA